MKFQRFFGDRMMKTQTGCVQRLSGNPLHIGIIEGISDQRIAQIFHMDPDLVSATGFQCQADQAVSVFFFQHFIVSNGRFAMFKVDGTLDDGAVLSSQWSGDGSGGGSDPAREIPRYSRWISRFRTMVARILPLTPCFAMIVRPEVL